MKFAIFVFFVLISGSVRGEESDVEYLFFDEITSTQAYAIEYGKELLINPS
ncbi:MAG: hypothetical protein KDK59_11450 [Simkania sp.]|nr:hypothetical protein [Simkania sp.]MCB9092839.1 hypothetical protein [Halobacteriovoraceae bacterium]